MPAAVGDHRKELRFCIGFAVLTVIAFGVLYAAQDALIEPLNAAIAWLAGTVVRGVGVSAATTGAVVTSGGFAVEIRNNCNAIYELGLYLAAVWAYPASVRAKVTGSLVGAGVLSIVNLLRVVSLLALGVFAREWFEVAHLYVWQALFFAVVAICWFAWALRVSPRA
jgi:exosortase H (IPTLxxWG-CTERM-specific)